MQSVNKNIIKFLWILILSCCLPSFSPAQSFAEEKTEQETLKQETEQLPSFGGKLDLTPQLPEENAEIKAETQSLRADENSANVQKNTEQKERAEQAKRARQTERAEQTGQAAQKSEQPRLPAQKDTILAPGHGNNSVMIQEDGSNVMIVHGSNKIPENYTNSTNINNGFYMNITNPDGSGMNMGTYSNSSSNSNTPRKQSKAQMIIDKME